MSVMNLKEFENFLTLAETLKANSWVIVKFEDLGGGVTLTIVPQKQSPADAE
jgi:hypothetical protein